MHLGIPELVKVVRHARSLDLSPVPAEAQAKAMTSEETLGVFLVLIGRFAAQRRMDDAEYQFSVEQASKSGINEEELKILKFIMQVLTTA